MTRQLRDKVAAGENQFAGVHCAVTIASINADGDASLEQGGELLLGHDTEGNPLVLDSANSSVIQLLPDGSKAVLCDDFIAFINALSLSMPYGLELGPAIDDPLDFPAPKRGLFDD